MFLVEKSILIENVFILGCWWLISWITQNFHVGKVVSKWCPSGKHAKFFSTWSPNGRHLVVMKILCYFFCILLCIFVFLFKLDINKNFDLIYRIFAENTEKIEFFIQKSVLLVILERFLYFRSESFSIRSDKVHW